MTSLPRFTIQWLDRCLVAVAQRRTARMRTDLERRALRSMEAGAESPLRALLDDADAEPLPERPRDGGIFLLAPTQAALLARIVRAGDVERILEFGTGYSTVVLASALAEVGGGSVTTVEDAPAWCEGTFARAEGTPGVEVRQLSAVMRTVLTRSGWARVYVGLERELVSSGPYDLVLVDGPFWRRGREGTLSSFAPHLRPGARIVLDDVARPFDRWVLSRWLAVFTGLELELYAPDAGHHGVAVLRTTGALKPRRSLRLLLDSLLLASLLAIARVAKPPPRVIAG
jgi:predicted O-methyltransferase YrrM